MTAPVFVDTSAFVALADRSDRNHVHAKRALRAIAKKKLELVTSTYVLDETFTLLRMRVSHHSAVAVGERLEQTRWCRVVDVGADTRASAWQIFVRYADQTFSFTDCTSFALMHAMRISDAFTFDRRDYTAAGFVVTPLISTQQNRP